MPNVRQTNTTNPSDQFPVLISLLVVSKCCLLSSPFMFSMCSRPTATNEKAPIAEAIAMPSLTDSRSSWYLPPFLHNILLLSSQWFLYFMGGDCATIEASLPSKSVGVCTKRMHRGCLPFYLKRYKSHSRSFDISLKSNFLFSWSCDVRSSG